MCPVPLLLHYSIFIKVFLCIQKTKEKAFSIAEHVDSPNEGYIHQVSMKVRLMYIFPRSNFEQLTFHICVTWKLKLPDVITMILTLDNFQFCGQITDNLNFLVKTTVAQVWCQQLGDQKNIAVIKRQWIRNSYKWMEKQRKKQSITVPL